MKKYIILVASVVAILVLTVAFDCIDRVGIAINGLSYYKFDEYNTSATEIENIEVTVRMNEYVGDEIVLYSSDNLKVLINDIQYNGDSYKMYVTSTGYGKYKEGSIVSLEYIKDKKIASSVGELSIELVGTDNMKKNDVQYVFSISPLGDVSMEELSKAEIELSFSGMQIINYERK